MPKIKAQRDVLNPLLAYLSSQDDSFKNASCALVWQMPAASTWRISIEGTSGDLYARARTTVEPAVPFDEIVRITQYMSGELHLVPLGC